MSEREECEEWEHPYQARDYKVVVALEAQCLNPPRPEPQSNCQGCDDRESKEKHGADISKIVRHSDAPIARLGSAGRSMGLENEKKKKKRVWLLEYNSDTSLAVASDRCGGTGL